MQNRPRFHQALSWGDFFVFNSLDDRFNGVTGQGDNLAQRIDALLLNQPAHLLVARFLQFLKRHALSEEALQLRAQCRQSPLGIADDGQQDCSCAKSAGMCQSELRGFRNDRKMLLGNQPPIVPRAIAAATGSSACCWLGKGSPAGGKSLH